MALATESSGTQTATITTEHSLAAPTSNKTRVLSVDLSNMVAGDVVELRVKTKVLSGSTAALAYYATFSNAVAEPVVYSVPVPSINGATFTLKQTAGTGRAYDFAILTLD